MPFLWPSSKLRGVGRGLLLASSPLPSHLDRDVGTGKIFLLVPGICLPVRPSQIALAASWVDRQFWCSLFLVQFSGPAGSASLRPVCSGCGPSWCRGWGSIFLAMLLLLDLLPLGFRCVLLFPPLNRCCGLVFRFLVWWCWPFDI